MIFYEVGDQQLVYCNYILVNSIHYLFLTWQFFCSPHSIANMVSMNAWMNTQPFHYKPWYHPMYFSLHLSFWAALVLHYLHSAFSNNAQDLKFLWFLPFAKTLKLYFASNSDIIKRLYTVLNMYRQLKNPVRHAGKQQSTKNQDTLLEQSLW